MNVNISIDKVLDNIFAGFRKITPALLSVDLVAGLILFGPQKLLQSIYISNLPINTLKIVSVIFLIATFILIINIIFYVIEKIKRKLYIRHLEKRLKTITFVERKFISLMYYAPAHSILMSYHGQIKGALLSKNIIVRTTNMSGNVGQVTFSYMLQPWVLKYIKRHPDFIQMTYDEAKEEYKIYYQNLNRGEIY